MFYVIEISKGDSKIEGKSVYEYDTLNLAVGTFHQKLSSAMKSELFTEELVMVIDGNGGIYKSEHYTKPIEEIKENE